MILDAIGASSIELVHGVMCRIRTGCRRLPARAVSRKQPGQDEVRKVNGMIGKSWRLERLSVRNYRGKQ